MTLTAMRWRGTLAVVAGLVLLLALPIYQAFWLRPSGYAPLRAGDVGSFGTYLVWASSHGQVELGLRAVEVVPFLLAIALPGALRRVLWSADRAAGRAPMLLGQIGFGLFAGVLLFGFAVVPSVAHNYVLHPQQRLDVARGYHALYMFETVAATAIGLGMVALSLAMLSLRAITSRRLPPWYAYVGLAAAGLLAATAVSALFGLSAVVTQLEQFSLPALALWVILGGVVLLRLRAQPQAAITTGQQTEPDEPATPSS